MNKKLKIALIHRTSEQGFALPVAIGLGLIMLLIGATMIVRSQGDRVTASAQKATASSFDITEAGITRIQSLLSKYGFLAATTLSNVDTSSTTWKQVYDASPSAIAGCPSAAAGATEVSEYRVDKWVDLGSGGQFRIINYTYTPDSARITATASITLLAIVGASVSLNNNISPADYLSDGSSVYGEINSVPGILSRNGDTYTFKRLSPGLDISINSSSTFTPKNTSAQLTASVTIPDKGSVNIANTNISPSEYLVDGGLVKGQIQGILGILSRSGTTYKFERLYPGTATTTTANFVPINTPGVATLTVEGRVNQSGTGDTATETTGTATSKLLINVPVKSGSLNTLVAGLWVKNNRITNMDRDKINGNIVINSCPPASGASSINVANSSTQKVIAEPIPLPDTPDLPPSYYTLTDSPFGKTFPRPAQVAIPAKGKTPAIPAVAADEPAVDGYYHYLVDNLVESGSGEITITPGKKVIFYVKGNIDLSGNPDINKTIGNTADQLQIYGNTYTSATTTKYGCAAGTTLGTGCPTLKAHFNGTGTMKAFVLAPDATGSVNGGGATNGNFKGTLWIKDWDASSGNDKVKVDASGEYSKYLISHKILKSPLIYPTTSWQRQER